MLSNYQKMFKELTVVFSEYYLNYLLYNKNAQKFTAYNLTTQQDTFFLSRTIHVSQQMKSQRNSRFLRVL